MHMTDFPKVHILDIESAINYWRQRPDAIDGVRLSKSLNALTAVYAEMVYDQLQQIEISRLSEEVMQAWLEWYETTPDAPCIAICSTSQGDDLCKGCGRTFEEVQHWTAMTPMQKRQVWLRISKQGTALRFTRYKERA